MKKTILTLIFGIVALTFCNAQQIEMKKVFGGYKYFQNGISEKKAITQEVILYNKL